MAEAVHVEVMTENMKRDYMRDLKQRTLFNNIWKYYKIDNVRVMTIKYQIQTIKKKVGALFNIKILQYILLKILKLKYIIIFLIIILCILWYIWMKHHLHVKAFNYIFNIWQQQQYKTLGDVYILRFYLMSTNNVNLYYKWLFTRKFRHKSIY